jgi:hypothetical protein
MSEIRIPKFLSAFSNWCTVEKVLSNIGNVSIKLLQWYLIHILLNNLWESTLWSLPCSLKILALKFVSVVQSLLVMQNSVLLFNFKVTRVVSFVTGLWVHVSWWRCTTGSHVLCARIPPSHLSHWSSPHVNFPWEWRGCGRPWSRGTGNSNRHYWCGGCSHFKSCTSPLLWQP